jgi:pimeloyl-ACP methyl ester carboxylesterase
MPRPPIRPLVRRYSHTFVLVAACTAFLAAKFIAHLLSPDHLRRQLAGLLADPKFEVSPPFEGIPQVGLGLGGRPSTAVVPNKDRTLRPAYLAEVAQARLGTDPVELATGHCPQVSHPDQVADLLQPLLRAVDRSNCPPLICPRATTYSCHVHRLALGMRATTLALPGVRDWPLRLAVRC